MKYLVFADVHANLAAFEAVLAAEQDFDRAIFLGDIVIAGPEPEACVKLLRQLDPIALSGNHDRQALNEPADPADPNPDKQWTRWTQSQLSTDSRAYLQSLPRTLAIECAGYRVRLHHGDFAQDVGRLWPDSPAQAFAQLSRQFDEPVIFAGHSHVQFHREADGLTFANPGSVGQPRLGRPEALYMLLLDGRIELKAVPYDVERTCAAMDELPLPPDYVAMWKATFRNAHLSERYAMRSWEPLIAAGYR